MIGKWRRRVAKGVLKAADHKCRPGRRQWHKSSIIVPFLTILPATARLMIFAPSFVAPQSFFDADRGLFGAVIGIWRHSFGFQECTRIEMQDALGTEPEPVFPHRRMSRIAAAEIF